MMMQPHKRARKSLDKAISACVCVVPRFAAFVGVCFVVRGGSGEGGRSVRPCTDRASHQRRLQKNAPL